MLSPDDDKALKYTDGCRQARRPEQRIGKQKKRDRDLVPVAHLVKVSSCDGLTYTLDRCEAFPSHPPKQKTLGRR